MDALPCAYQLSYYIDTNMWVLTLSLTNEPGSTTRSDFQVVISYQEAATILSRQKYLLTNLLHSAHLVAAPELRFTLTP